MSKMKTSLCAGALLILGACGKTNPNADATLTGTYSYAGPGSHYTVENAAGAYIISKYSSTSSTTVDFRVTAGAVDVNGFKKLTISAVTGSGGPTVGSTTYGLEVPGFALFVQPVSTSAPDQVITAVSSGSCPVTDLSANWVIVKQTGSSNVSSAATDTFGTFLYNATTGVAGLPTKYSLANPTTNLGSSTFSSATCSNGIMTVSTPGDTAVMYLTAGGGAIVNTASSNASNSSFIFGMPAATVTGTNFSGTYSGLVYMGGQTAGTRLKPIKFTLTGTATGISGSGNTLSEPSTDTASSTTASINITSLNSPSAGLMTGTLTTSAGTANISCMAVYNANNSGKQMMNCAGADPSSTSSLFNFLLVSR